MDTSSIWAEVDRTHARWMSQDPSWNVAALLTRDEPGGEWREVTEAAA